MKDFIKAIALFSFLLIANFSFSQFTKQDTLRGSNGLERSWWDVVRYDITVEPDIPNKTIKGTNKITFIVTDAGKSKTMQIDLQKPMEIEKIEDVNRKQRQLSFTREGNVCHVDFAGADLTKDKEETIIIHFKGKPRIAVQPPWDGGWIWTHDEKARPWITVACQGLGASVWYPCKDYQGDEPDRGASLAITVPDTLVAVGNGRLKNKKSNNNGTTTWLWEVVSPINNYTIIPYIGKYVNWEEKYNGESGELDCSYWVMDYNLEKAKKHFGRDVKPMMKCFEEWFGPYPFYKDSYKMVETPHLGMEHQSAVAYGNKYRNGYLGMDLSGTGWGTKWDYIIIHESGHEWFGNNITTNDIADMWVHEGFTDYSETIFVECQYGKKAGDQYTQGLRKNIQNDIPIIGPYGVNKEGSGDMYYKGSNLIHTIRHVMNNDPKFKEILRGLNKEFYHKTVNTADIENYISQKSGKDLSKIFDQYLRTTKIPVLEYKIKDNTLSYRWNNCVKDFEMPIMVTVDKKDQWIVPKEEWQTLSSKISGDATFEANKNFYIDVKKVE